MFEFGEGAALGFNPFRVRVGKVQVLITVQAIRGPRARRFAWLHFLWHWALDVLEGPLFRCRQPAVLVTVRSESGDGFCQGEPLWLEAGDDYQITVSVPREAP